MPNIKNIQYSTTGTGGSIDCMDATDDLVLIHEAAALAVTLTINLPPNPVDGQQIKIVSVNGITTLTLAAAVGTIINVITTMSVGGIGGYVFRKANTKWYKIL